MHASGHRLSKFANRGKEFFYRWLIHRKDFPTLSTLSNMISKQFLCDLAYGDVPIQRGRQPTAATVRLRPIGLGRLSSTMELVPPTRIERATRGLGNRCSIQLSYGGMA